MATNVRKKTKAEPRLREGSVKVDLKFYDDTFRDKPIKCIVQDEFKTFVTKHQEAQESEDNPLSVELKLFTIIRNLETNEIEREEAFKPMVE